MDKPWESLELEEIQQKPYPLVRERLRTHTGAEAVYVYVPGQHEWVCALPVTQAGNVVLIRQYRHIWGDFFLELPAGAVDPGESPAQGIRREMLEEAGLDCEELIALPRNRFLGSFVASMGNPFLALGAHKVQDSTPEDGELIKVVEYPLGQVYEMLGSYEGFDAATTMTLFWAKPILLERGFLG